MVSIFSRSLKTKDLVCFSVGGEGIDVFASFRFSCFERCLLLLPSEGGGVDVVEGASRGIVVVVGVASGKSFDMAKKVDCGSGGKKTRPVKRKEGK